MAKQLFGTDGIRGVAGEFPLDPQTVHAFGAALGAWAARHGDQPEVVIGIDTRESGPWLAEQVAGGLARQGVGSRFAGLITTPGIAHMTRLNSFLAGVMISASHNLYQDNGLKVFGDSGYKLPDDEEHTLEQEILRLRGTLEATPASLSVEPALAQRYVDYLASTASSLRGLSVVVDCGNGSASPLAPDLFERLGARVYTIGCSPNGRNINLGCGALDVEPLRRHVLEHDASLGVAFDGDADRAIFVSGSGKVVDGDYVLLLSATSLLAQGRLTGNNGRPVVVATVMSNLGLERALAAHGVHLARTPVGDKYVLEEMVRRDAKLGGEQSGHVIFLDYATAGDGMLTALRVFDIMRQSGKSLDELTANVEMYPQRLINIRVKSRKPLEELESVTREIRAVEQYFGDRSRVLVRFSGTEPLARVMVEGPDQARVDDFAGRIAEAIRSELGYDK